MPNIHPTAIIGEGVSIAEGVTIGAYSIISGNVEIGSGTKIESHVVIKGTTVIGKDNQFFQFSSIGEDPQDKKYTGEDTQLIIGNNNVIREFVTLNRGTSQGGSKTSIGHDNLIMAYVHVAHDCIIGDNNILANNVALAGHVNVHENVILGGFSLIHQFCTIGSYAFSAMNSVISKDVPPCLMVSGHMAKPHGLNIEGLKRHQISSSTIKQLKEVYSILYRSKMTVEEAMEKLIQLENKSSEVKQFIYFLENNINRGIIR